MSKSYFHLVQYEMTVIHGNIHDDIITVQFTHTVHQDCQQACL